MSKHIIKNVKKSAPGIIRFIEILLNESATLFIRHGENRQIAEKMSRAFVIDALRHLESNLVYLGKNTLLDARLRHDFIRDDHAAWVTIEQLAASYNLSTRQIYTIVFYKKVDEASKAARAVAPVIATSAARMMIKIGVQPNDAIEAVRGMLAVISVKTGGNGVYIPKTDNIKKIIRDIEIIKMHRAGRGVSGLSRFFNLTKQETQEVIDNYPVEPLAARNSLSLLKKRILNIVDEFNEVSPATCRLLEAAADSVEKQNNRAEH